MSTTTVEKGLQFEKAVVDMLNKCGFRAWRTNQSNEADLERYKAGFDGGIDIIATFDVVKPICRNVCFGLSTLFQTNFFRLFFRYCTGV